MTALSVDVVARHEDVGGGPGKDAVAGGTTAASQRHTHHQAVLPGDDAGLDVLGRVGAVPGS